MLSKRVKTGGECMSDYIDGIIVFGVLTALWLVVIIFSEVLADD